jgi:carbon monoxide dehydrogenase subunit G
MDFRFSGSFDVPHKPAEVYAFLSNPERFAPLLPDFESLEKSGEDQYTVKSRVGVSHIRGTATIRLRLAEATPPTHAVYEGKGEVPGGMTTLRAGFELVAAGDGTRVDWTGEAKIAGRLPSLAGGLLEPLARKNIDKLIAGLKAALS